jgi:hypothetical protein
MKMNIQVYAPGSFTPGKELYRTYWIGGLVGLRVGLDLVAKRKSLPQLEINPRSFSQ